MGDSWGGGGERSRWNASETNRFWSVVCAGLPSLDLPDKYQERRKAPARLLPHKKTMKQKRRRRRRRRRRRNAPTETRNRVKEIERHGRQQNGLLFYSLPFFFFFVQFSLVLFCVVVKVNEEVGLVTTEDAVFFEGGFAGLHSAVGGYLRPPEIPGRAETERIERQTDRRAERLKEMRWRESSDLFHKCQNRQRIPESGERERGGEGVEGAWNLLKFCENSLSTYEIRNRRKKAKKDRLREINSERILKNPEESSSASDPFNMHPPKHLQSSPIISEHLQSSQNISKHLQASPSISEHLQSSPIISNHLQSSPIISNHLRASQSISEHLRASQSISGHPRTLQQRQY